MFIFSFSSIELMFEVNILLHSITPSDIKLFSKILHYLEKPTFYYYCTVIENTKINPFKKITISCVQFQAVFPVETADLVNWRKV